MIELVMSPRPDDDKHWYQRDIPLKFEECETCRAKPGSPVLCHGCLNNREVIGRLRGAIARKKSFSTRLRALLNWEKNR